MERIDINKLSENLKKLLQPNTPTGLKMLAIKGSLPLKPLDYVVFVYLMLSNENDEIRNLASQTFATLPSKILMAVLLQPLPEEVLDKIAYEYRSDRQVIEKILMNNSTSDETFEMIASFVDEKLLDIIARNQVRILRYPAIIKAICGNPNATASQKSMVIEFAQKSGINLESIGIQKDFKDKKEIIQNNEPEPANGTESGNIGGIPVEADQEEITLDNESKIAERNTGSPSASNRDELIKRFNLDREYYDEGIPLSEEKEKRLIEELEHMDEAKQMALVEVGRHRVKQIMAKSPLASVALAAVKHPDITTDDIFKIAQDRTANTEAIKYIATHRDYIRVYNIKLKLALNPKTPVPMAMAFVRSLRLSDLKNIAKNASVSKILQNTAKGIMKMHS